MEIQKLIAFVEVKSCFLHVFCMCNFTGDVVGISFFRSLWQDVLVEIMDRWEDCCLVPKRSWKKSAWTM